MREATLAASLLIDFVGFVERRGVAPARLCLAAQIDREWLRDPSARVPASAMQRLWSAAERLTGDADVGLHSAESYNPGALNIVGYVILSSATTGEALRRLARYAPLLNEGLQVSVFQEGGLTHCRFGPAEGFDSFLRHAPRHAVETLAAGIVLTLKRLSSSQPLDPVAVTLRHAVPASIDEHRRLLGPNLRFAQAENAVVYADAAMAAPLMSADPALLELFEVDARRRIDQLEAHGPLSARVQAMLAARIKGDVPSLAAIASALAMSERSIQRGLSDESTSYRALVDEVRKGLALAHLSRPGVSATDVAFVLGFSEPSAFTRAFRRWTGTSPSRYRPV
jgi:AraC-like DNA-binding protein